MRMPSQCVLSARLNVAISAAPISQTECKNQSAHRPPLQLGLRVAYGLNPTPHPKRLSPSGIDFPERTPRGAKWGRWGGTKAGRSFGQGMRPQTSSTAEKPPLRFLFPDIDVWLALSDHDHEDHGKCYRWFRNLDSNDRICFCRVTQVGLLKHLTAGAVMGGEEALHCDEAWHVIDDWSRDSRIIFLAEPSDFEEEFRALSQRGPTCESWNNVYLIAFARVAGLRLVTMDEAMRDKSAGIELLH